MKVAIVLTAIFAIVLASCAPASTSMPIETSIPTAILTFVPTTTLTPVPPMPTITPTQDNCARSASQAHIPSHFRKLDFPNTNLNELTNAIANALNSGALPVEIDVALGFPFQGQAIAFDFENDGINEVVTITHILYSTTDDDYSSNAVVVFHCKNGIYEASIISDITILSTDLGDFFAGEDFFNDGDSELVINQHVYSMDSACSINIIVIGKIDGGYKDLLAGKEKPDCPGSIELSDVNKDGLIDIVIHGKTSSNPFVERNPKDLVTNYIASKNKSFNITNETVP